MKRFSGLDWLLGRLSSQFRRFLMLLVEFTRGCGIVKASLQQSTVGSTVK